MLSGARRAVLIVCYDSDLREYLQYFFRLHGWIVDFPDPETSPVQKLALREYEIVVVDFDLPLPDGVDFIETMRFGGNLTPALLVSAILPKSALAPRVENLVNTVLLDDPYSLERLRDACTRVMSLTWIRRRRAGA